MPSFFRRGHRLATPEGYVRQLIRLVRSRTIASTELTAAIASGRAIGHDRHYGLAIALGEAAEMLASLLPWGERASPIENARDDYLRALALAASGHIEEADLFPEIDPTLWRPGATLAERAYLHAAWRAGVLLASEFRVRDPSQAITLLLIVETGVVDAHPVFYYLGEAFALAERFEEAERAWQEGLRRAPGDQVLADVLGRLPIDRVHHAARQSHWAAVRSWLDPGPIRGLPETERLTLLGDASHELGDDQAARQHWERALAIDRHAVGVQKRLRSIDRSRH